MQQLLGLVALPEHCPRSRAEERTQTVAGRHSAAQPPAAVIYSLPCQTAIRRNGTAAVKHLQQPSSKHKIQEASLSHGYWTALTVV